MMMHLQSTGKLCLGLMSSFPLVPHKPCQLQTHCSSPVQDNGETPQVLHCVTWHSSETGRDMGYEFPQLT